MDPILMGGGGRMSGAFESGELTRSITGYATEVHRELGNGFQEVVHLSNTTPTRVVPDTIQLIT
ncbi:MAG TPA: hypothetical protein VGS41_02780 [Chthonomonadales bacterium]|nr:hypothetical protein [Chthonomonadales bacterium]